MRRTCIALQAAKKGRSGGNKTPGGRSGGLPERLHKIEAARTYYPQKPVSLPLLHHRLFKLKALHKFHPSEDLLAKNRRGFTTGAATTAAVAPSLTHYLFHRGGICFDEAAALLQAGRIEVDGEVVRSEAAMESQEYWHTVASRDIRIRPAGDTRPLSSAATGAAASPPVGESVPVAHRALHRTYLMGHVNPAKHNVTTEMADPKSLVHVLAKGLSPTERIGMNIVRPMGFISGMGGLAVVTNDVLTLRHWNNEFVGNHGVYCVGFHRGAPEEELLRVEALVTEALRPVLAQQQRDVLAGSSYGCQLVSLSSRFEGSGSGAGTATLGDILRPHAAPVFLQKLHDTCLVVRTPLFPYRLFRALRPRTHMCALVGMGPFQLPANIPRGAWRPLDVEELTAFFTFERKLKTNRLVLTLREFEYGEDGDAADVTDADADASQGGQEAGGA